MSGRTSFTQFCSGCLTTYLGAPEEHVCELMPYVEYAPLSTLPQNSLRDDDTALWAGGLYESSQLHHTPLGYDLVDHSYTLFGDHLFV